MPIRRSPSLDDITGHDELRQCRAATVVNIYSEEHTPVAGPGSHQLAQLGDWAAARDELESTPSVVSAPPSHVHDSEAQQNTVGFDAPQPLLPSHPPPIPPRSGASLPPMAASTRSSSPPPPPPRNTARMVLLPAARPTSNISRADALLPEMAHDPHYYPGLVPAAHERAEPEPEIVVRRAVPKWLWHAVAGATLFAAGLAVASLRSGPESSIAPSKSKPVEPPSEAAHIAAPPAPVATAPIAAETPESPVSASDNVLADKPLESAAPLSASELAKQRRAERRAAIVAKRYLSRKAHTGQPSGTGATASADMAASVEPAAATGTKTGTLQINSRPWADVYVDNKPVGHTPQMGLQLSPGHHTIKLTNPTMGMSKTLSVTIRAGETIKKIETLGG
jgi:hypothetical protein